MGGGAFQPLYIQFDGSNVAGDCSIGAGGGAGAQGNESKFGTEIDRLCIGGLGVG